MKNTLPKFTNLENKYLSTQSLCVLMIFITRAQYAPGLCVCVRRYVCVCVDKKHACLRLTARKSPQKLSLQLLHWIYSHKKTLSVLASLVRAANSWLSKATCPCKSTLRYCGCVTQPPIHVDVLTQSHMYSTSEPRDMRAQNLIIATVSAFLEAFCDVPINC